MQSMGVLGNLRKVLGIRPEAFEILDKSRLISKIFASLRVIFGSLQGTIGNHRDS